MTTTSSATAESGLARLLSVAAGFMAAKAMLSAVELGIFTWLGDGPRSGARLAAEAGLHPRGAQDFLDALVALGLLERDGDVYRNTPDADTYLDQHKPTYVGGILETANAWYYSLWGSLTDALRTGEPQAEADGVDHSPAADRARRYQDGMAWLLAPLARVLIGRIDWTRFGRVVELGGGIGPVVIQLAQSFPHISGGVMGEAPEFAENVERLFLDDRLEVFDGDCFTDPLPPADAYVLGGILHRRAAAERDALLARVHGSLPSGGTVIVYNTMLDDSRRQNALGFLASLTMLLETPAGREFTTAECREWLQRAGFRTVTTEVLGQGWSAVIGVK